MHVHIFHWTGFHSLDRAMLSYKCRTTAKSKGTKNKRMKSIYRRIADTIYESEEEEIAKPHPRIKRAWDGIRCGYRMQRDGCSRCIVLPLRFVSFCPTKSACASQARRPNNNIFCGAWQRVCRWKDSITARSTHSAANVPLAPFNGMLLLILCAIVDNTHLFIASIAYFYIISRYRSFLLTTLNQINSHCLIFVYLWSWCGDRTELCLSSAASLHNLSLFFCLSCLVFCRMQKYLPFALQSTLQICWAERWPQFQWKSWSYSYCETPIRCLRNENEFRFSVRSFVRSMASWLCWAMGGMCACVSRFDYLFYSQIYVLHAMTILVRLCNRRMQTKTTNRFGTHARTSSPSPPPPPPRRNR